MIKAIEAMDKKSEEFFKVYCAVNEKYWDIDEPDDVQQACMFLNTVINRGDDFPSQVVLASKLLLELLQMETKKLPAIHGSFKMESGKEIHFDFYTDKNALTNLEKMLRNSIVMKGKELDSEEEAGK